MNANHVGRGEDGCCTSAERPRAEYIGYQNDENGNPLFPLFNVIDPGHPKHGSTVDFTEAHRMRLVDYERFQSLMLKRHTVANITGGF